MSIRTKLSIIMSILVTIILIGNNTLYYLSSRNQLIQDQKNQMEQTAKEIRISIEQTQNGSTYVEKLIDQKLRDVAIAAKYALSPDASKVTNQQLVDLSKKLNVSDITLFQQKGNDIVGVKSSDPKEINLSSKDWGYWYQAFQQLFKDHQAKIPEGQTLENFWAGPIDVSSSNPSDVDKYGYYYDGTTNYIIDPYLKDQDIMQFNNDMGPQSIIPKLLKDNSDLLEITGFNPKTFGKPPIITKSNGVSYVRLTDSQIQFGNYSYKDANDSTRIQQAFITGQPVTFVSTINGKTFLKTFFPIASGNQPFVIGVVSNFQVIQAVLNQDLLRNMLISLLLLILVFFSCYFLSGFMVRPVQHILQKVNEIAKGNFGVQVNRREKDELGQLAHQVNIMSLNLKSYTDELEERQKQIKHQALHDFLTGLPNRLHFNEKLNAEVGFAKQNGNRLAVIFLDLDRFKNINDTLGHEKGDLLLKIVAKRITDCLPQNATVFRLGGDEFTILMTNIQTEDATSTASAIISVLESPISLDGYEVVVAPSIGISYYPNDAKDIESLVKNADTAMYAAKDQGGNNFSVYTPKMNEFGLERMELENKMRKAFEKDEFRLYYQPKISLKSGKITGMEALIRWHSPEGIISPGKFIPLAEETGLIVPLGEWILRTACEQTKQWHKAGYPLRISVNLSARQFDQKDLVDNICRIIQETEFDPKFLELEITETILMKNIEETKESLLRLKKLGVQFSIDDFGTGYSSMSYLKRFPIDCLKIDQSFVRDLSDTTKNTEIASAIISLGHSLKLKVVAEGVENLEQLQFLQSKNCDEIQGFYFSRPLPEVEFEELLQKDTKLALAIT